MRTRIMSVVFFAVMLFTCNALCACSRDKSPILPAGESDSPGVAEGIQSSRMLWGMWEISFDPWEQAIKITPLRELQAHFNVTAILLPPECSDCLVITVNSFDPITHILDADVTLRNPLALAGHDVRGILFTDDYGHGLTNADDWSALWDVSGGLTINPFKAFAKMEDHRLFAPGATHEENYLLCIPTPPHWEGITFACDASWPSNCAEPYEITNFTQEDIFDEAGSSGEIHIDVLDWQDNVSSVAISVPEITGEETTQLTHQVGDTWGVNLVNNAGAAIGNYTGKIIATSNGSGKNKLYDFVSVVISEYNIAFNPVDVTPPWINCDQHDICAEGNYLYIAGGRFGLHIYDVSDPYHPVWVNRVETDIPADRVTVSNGYAYVGNVWGGGSDPTLAIIDIDPPESAYLAQVLHVLDPVGDIAVSGDYAYVTAADLMIFYINPHESAHLVKTVDFYGGGTVTAFGGYTYVQGVDADYQQELWILDVDPPEEAHVINTVSITAGGGYDLVLRNGYVYVPSQSAGLQIIDVDPPESASLAATVDTPGYAQYVGLWNDYAYVGDAYGGMQIIDITTPETATLVKTVDLPAYTYNVAMSGGYAYVRYNGGISVVDVEPYDSANVISGIYSQGYASDVAWSDGYLYSTDYGGYLLIMDASPPEFLMPLNTVCFPAAMNQVEVAGDYAYALNEYGSNGFKIIKINPPEEAYLVNIVDVSDRNFAVSGDYAYVANDSPGVSIIDINPPESAQVVATVDTPAWANDIAIFEDKAYVASGPGGLVIIDISDPETAYILKQCGSGNLADVDAASGYAYVSSATVNSGLEIIDVEPYEEAHVVGSVTGLKNVRDIDVEGGYAYVTCYDDGLRIVDIDPPEKASIVDGFDVPIHVNSVTVSGEYAYLAEEQNGLRVIKLW